MKIVRIVDGYAYPTTVGPNIFIHTLSTELVKRGHQNIIYSTTTGKEQPTGGEINGYLVKNYRPLLKLWSFPLSIKLIIDVIGEKPDIIHVRGYRSSPSELAAWIRILKGVPYVLSPHGSLLGYKNLTPNKLSEALHTLYDIITGKLALKKASFIAATSNQEAAEAMKLGVPQAKVRVMPHAEDLAEIATPILSAIPPPRILAVGRVDPIQNWHTLIRAFAQAVKQVPQAEMVLVGPSSFSHTHIGFEQDYQHKLLQLCHELNVEEKVTFTGPLYGEELRNAYASCGVFAYVIPYGCYGRTHIEAAAFGKPIISTSVGIIPDLVGDNEGGILVAPYDEVGIAQAMVNLLTDANLYRKKQKALLEKVKIFLDVNRMVDEYEKLYQEVTT